MPADPERPTTTGGGIFVFALAVMALVSVLVTVWVSFGSIESTRESCRNFWVKACAGFPFYVEKP